MTCSEDTLQTLVRLIYEAALEPAVWNQFLEKFSLAVNGSSAALMVHDFSHSGASIAESIGIEPHWQKLYSEHYCGLNTWLKNAPQLLVPGVVAQTQQATTDEELKRTEFYNDYLRPQNFFYSFGGTFGKEDAVVSYLTALRSQQAGAFGEPEMAVIRFLMPHLDCALRVHSHISGLQKRLNASATALDWLPWAVVLVDSQSRPILVNRAAQKIVAQDDGLSLTPKGLLTADQTAAEALQEALCSAIPQGSHGRTFTRGRTLLVARPSLRRPYEVLITPIPVQTRLTEAPAAMAAIFITDPEVQPVTDQETLRSLYGLTEAEARMAAAMAQGKTAESIAEEFELSLHTARNRVKRILSKTKTNRQSELLRLLLNSPARLRGLET
jgi:DNA-binding CsgD family transcriptional regulator